MFDWKKRLRKFQKPKAYDEPVIFDPADYIMPTEEEELRCKQNSADVRTNQEHEIQEAEDDYEETEEDEFSQLETIFIKLASFFAFCLVLFICFVIYQAVFVKNLESETIEAGIGEASKPTFSWLFRDVTDDVSVKGEKWYRPDTVGEYDITYWYHLKKFEKHISVVDTTPPVITLKGKKKITIQSFNSYKEEGFEVYDNCKKCNDSIYKSSKVTRNYIGDDENGQLYEIVYSVSDNHGNKATVKRIIHINNGVVYLTFDDGPSEMVTSKVLDILKKYDVKATFFVISTNGNEEKQALLKRAAEEGHTIALHGKSHDYSEIYSSLNSVVQNFENIQNEVEELTGAKATLIRFPGGSSNTISKNYSIGIMTEATQKVTEMGFTYFDWNVDSNDAGSDNQNSDAIEDNVLKGLKYGEESVVLMHDGEGHEATAEALERIISEGKKRGFVFKPLNAESYTAHHSVNN